METLTEAAVSPLLRELADTAESLNLVKRMRPTNAAGAQLTIESRYTRNYLAILCEPSATGSWKHTLVVSDGGAAKRKQVRTARELLLRLAAADPANRA